MLFELINPSDPYTLEAESKAVASAAALFLSQACGLRTQDDSWTMAPKILGGCMEWFQEEFGEDLVAFIGAHLREIADCLDTLLIGDFSARADYMDAVSRMPQEARTEYRANRHDRRRSSMNDYAAAAVQWSRDLRMKAEALKGDEGC